MPPAERMPHSVMITGAAGSIGSALARILAGCAVERLVLLDSCEAGLREVAGQIAAEAVSGNAGDPVLLNALFQRERFDVVYHAAAWKQVPELESEPFRAIENNALVTHTLAQAAVRARIPKLVLVSTDKAVNPRSIMGASKRIAELTMTSLSSPACRMNAVRLCNVFGSSGSVVPIFREQIAQGVPVTVTDPNASRWFLTMQQAVDAILSSGRTRQTGKILLPAPGKPVLIRELAASLMGAAGGGAGIRYIGLRPGEKLTEELRGAREREVGKEEDLTVIETNRLEVADLVALTCDLSRCICERDLCALLAVIRRAVPEYEPSRHLLGQAASAASATA